jgi:hypothetical protein
LDAARQTTARREGPESGTIEREDYARIFAYHVETVFRGSARRQQERAGKKDCGTAEGGHPEGRICGSGHPVCEPWVDAVLFSEPGGA